MLESAYEYAFFAVFSVVFRASVPWSDFTRLARFQPRPTPIDGKGGFEASERISARELEDEGAKAVKTDGPCRPGRTIGGRDRRGVVAILLISSRAALPAGRLEAVCYRGLLVCQSVPEGSHCRVRPSGAVLSRAVSCVLGESSEPGLDTLVSAGRFTDVAPLVARRKPNLPACRSPPFRSKSGMSACACLAEFPNPAAGGLARSLLLQEASSRIITEQNTRAMLTRAEGVMIR
jgi:hypothetical protein